MGISTEIEANELASSGVDHIRVRILPDGRLSADDAARYLGRARGTLATWRMRGVGPRWSLVGGRIFYRLSELQRFVEEGK